MGNVKLPLKMGHPIPSPPSGVVYFLVMTVPTFCSPVHVLSSRGKSLKRMVAVEDLMKEDIWHRISNISISHLNLLMTKMLVCKNQEEEKTSYG